MNTSVVIRIDGLLLQGRSGSISRLGNSQNLRWLRVASRPIVFAVLGKLAAGIDQKAHAVLTADRQFFWVEGACQHGQRRIVEHPQLIMLDLCHRWLKHQTRC